MHDEMSAEFAEEKAAEEAAITAFDQLMAAKTKEVNALTKAIEQKMTRSGELAVEIVQMKNDLGNTAEALEEDKKFLADMEKNCAKKTAEWEVIVKTRNEELLAPNEANHGSRFSATNPTSTNVFVRSVCVSICVLTQMH